MSDAAYHIIAITVAAVAMIKGFRSGFTGQVSGVLGFAFGTVCAHVFDDQAEGVIRSLLSGLQGVTGADFIYSVTSAALVYVGVFIAFRIFTKVLRSAMQVFYVGMLDKLLGSAFCLAKYMLLLSIVYNLILCVNPSSRLLRYATAEDGNIVEVVMMLAPGLLGCYSYEDLSHLIQLKEAKKISRNINCSQGVIDKDIIGHVPETLSVAQSVDDFKSGKSLSLLHGIKGAEIYKQDA